jgi:hypothetical protein
VSALGSLAGVVGVGVVVAIFGVEARGWLARLSRWVTRRAVQRFPETQRARYEQEWPAELDELLKERPVSAVLWAVGYFVTASKVASVREGTTPARIKTPWGHNERLRVRYSDLQQRAVVDGWTITRDGGWVTFARADKVIDVAEVNRPLSQVIWILEHRLPTTESYKPPHRTYRPRRVHR